MNGMSESDIICGFNLYNKEKNGYQFKILLQVVKCKNLEPVPMKSMLFCILKIFQINYFLLLLYRHIY